MYNSKIAGCGQYLPEKIMTNSMLEEMVDTSDEWIVSRTGIKERHITGENEFTSDLATKAALKAIENASLSSDNIDMIIVATITPDMATPSVSCIVQKNIGAINAVAFDINSACAGFIYGFTIANQFIKTGDYSNILVIGADCLSKVTDW